VLYTIIIIMLAVIVSFSADNSLVLIYRLIVHPGEPANLPGIINALILTIIIVRLFETVTRVFQDKTW
jgi:hypothetical protein